MGINYNPRTVTDGLVLYLDVGNPRSYPGSGTTLTDLSGFSSNGIIINRPVYDSSNGGSFILNGVQQRIETSVLPYQFLTTGLTVSIFFRYLPLTANDNLISWGSGAYNGTAYAWEIRLRGNNGNIEFSPGIGPGGTGIPDRLQYISPIGWGSRRLCIDVTFQANGLATLYENGINVASRNYSGIGVSPQTNSISIGRGTDSHFPGNIHSVKVYNRALSASEVIQNFAALRGRYEI